MLTGQTSEEQDTWDKLFSDGVFTSKLSTTVLTTAHKFKIAIVKLHDSHESEDEEEKANESEEEENSTKASNELDKEVAEASNESQDEFFFSNLCR